ncbi:MAG: ComF family protein [Spirosomataceae bacterium]
MRTNWFKSLLDILYPKLCITCENQLQINENQICTSCLLDLPYTDTHKVGIIALENKFVGRVDVAKIFSFVRFSKKSGVQKLLHALKYKANEKIGNDIGVYYGKLIKKEVEEYKLDYLLPVPIHPKKLKTRGYNQAEVFSKGLSESLEIKTLTDVLLKTRETVSQTKENKQERFENIKGSFKIIEAGILKGKNIAIVDDVLTTGATLEEIAQILKNVGVSKVVIITIATAY